MIKAGDVSKDQAPKKESIKKQPVAVGEQINGIPRKQADLGSCDVFPVLKHAKDDQIFWKPWSPVDPPEKVNSVVVVDKPKGRVIDISFKKDKEARIKILGNEVDIRELEPTDQKFFEDRVEEIAMFLDNVTLDHLMN